MHGNVWEWVSDCWHATYASEEEKNRRNLQVPCFAGRFLGQ